MRDLNYVELKTTNGGNVPSAYYLDSDVISANGKVFGEICSFTVGLFGGFFKALFAI